MLRSLCEKNVHRGAGAPYKSVMYMLGDIMYTLGDRNCLPTSFHLVKCMLSLLSAMTCLKITPALAPAPLPHTLHDIYLLAPVIIPFCIIFP